MSVEKPLRTEHRKGLTEGVFTAPADFTENQVKDSGIRKGKRITVYCGISDIAGCWVQNIVALKQK